jgi:hypothetical protein
VFDRKPVVIQRLGKTARDKTSGAWARGPQNVKARGAWSSETHRGRSKGTVFPLETCNGRKSRALKRPSHSKKGVSGGAIIRKGA